MGADRTFAKAKTKRGRPAQDHRQLLNGILWVLRTGTPWRDMPERYGKWTTIYSRFQRWRKSGVWNKMFAELQTALDVESNVDWEIHFIDSTTVQSHQHPERLVADKGYTSVTFRRYLHRKHIRCTIARRSNERCRGSFNKQHYRKRNIVERLINRLKQFRRIATRYEKRAVNFSAIITIASIFLFSDFAYRL